MNQTVELLTAWPIRTVCTFRFQGVRVRQPDGSVRIPVDEIPLTQTYELTPYRSETMEQIEEFAQRIADELATGRHCGELDYGKNDRYTWNVKEQ